MSELTNPSGSLPRVVIDARMLGVTPHGIARYVKNLAHGLAEKGSLPYKPVFLITRQGIGQIPDCFDTKVVSTGFLSRFEAMTLPRVIRGLSADLYHSPSFSSLLLSPCPWIVTIHDLNHLHFGNAQQKFYYQFVLRNFALKAKTVMTVSEFSRAEISKWLECPSQKIEVVYNAIDPMFCARDEDVQTDLFAKHHLKPGNYFLCISHHQKKHKNTALLLKAYREARRRSVRLPPLVVNGDSKELPIQGVEGVIAVGKIPDGDMKALLQGCRAVLFPSLYEGFGLPPLESAFLGSRVVLSDIASHREALVDFGPPQLEWLPPGDLESWVQAFMRLKMSDLARAQYAPDEEQLGRAESRFSKQRLAEHMDQIYRTVLEV